MVFSMELGALAEAALVLPGMWFGMPVSAWGLIPLSLAWAREFRDTTLADDEDFWLEPALLRWGLQPSAVTWTRHVARDVGLASRDSAEFALISLIPVTAWALACFVWLSRGRIVNAYLYTKHLMFPCTVGSLVFMGHYAPVGVRAATFFLCAWVVAQVVGFVLKISAARLRPHASPLTAPRLATVPRAFPELQQMLKVGESAVESFPSGDTIGATVFATQLRLMHGCSAPVAVSVALLTAFCRMYFHAHHFADVVVGLLVGWGCTHALAWVCEHVLAVDPLDAFSTYSAGAFLSLFIAFHIAAQRFKPVLPPHLVVEGRKGF